MSLTRANLVELALGEAEARKVDYAIPQGMFDRYSEAIRADIAGWYYAPEAKIFGRLLTQTECWRIIQKKVEAGELVVLDPTKVEV